MYAVCELDPNDGYALDVMHFPRRGMAETYRRERKKQGGWMSQISHIKPPKPNNQQLLCGDPNFVQEYPDEDLPF